MSRGKATVPGLDDVAQSDIVFAKTELAMAKLEKVAAKSMYLNLLTGRYNKAYNQRLVEEEKMSAQSGEKEATNSVKTLAMEDFPDHLIDKVVSTGTSEPVLFQSTFDRFIQGKAKDFQGLGLNLNTGAANPKQSLMNNFQDRKNIERNMYMLAAAQKHAFTRKYIKHRGFRTEQLKTKQTVKSTYWRSCLDAFVTVNLAIAFLR